MTTCDKIQILTRAMSIAGLHSETKRNNISVDEVIANYRKLRNVITEDGDHPSESREQGLSCL